MPNRREVVFVRSAGRTLALGAVVGSTAAPSNAAMRAIAATLEGALAHAADVQRSDAGPMQKAERVQQALAPAVRSLQESAQAVLNVRRTLEKRMNEPVIAPWSAATPYFQVNVDTLLAQRFASMDPKQRAMTLGEVRSNPVEHMDMLGALMRVPRALSGLSGAEVAGLQTTALRAIRPDDFSMLLTEAEQLAVAERAMVIAGQIVVDAGVSRADLMTHAPAANEIAKLNPLALQDENPPAPRMALHAA